MEILDLETGIALPTCLGNATDFASSPDSRYFALQGVIEGQDMDESLGVYVSLYALH